MKKSDNAAWLSAKQVCLRYSISQPTLWRWVKLGRFPSPVKIGPNTTRWRVADLLAYEDGLDSQPGEKTKGPRQ